jgi:hypothetical protein
VPAAGAAARHSSADHEQVNDLRTDVSRVALLDIGVWWRCSIRINHTIWHDWFTIAAAGWATCPLTENGLIRVLSIRPLSGAPLRAAEMLDRLPRLSRGPASVLADAVICSRIRRCSTQRA